MTYDSNGNLTNAIGPSVATTSTFDKENRLATHNQAGVGLASFTYSAFGKKRSEDLEGAVTTLIWDGEDYLQGRS